MGTAAMATLEIRHINNSVSREGKIPSNAVNRPKTNTYPKHYEVSDDNIFTIIISPKPWHPIFATQVDKIILSTCDILKYHFQTFTDCLPSQFPCL